MIDYEVEYNNRARVPEHPQIFARWAAEAAAYRERMFCARTLCRVKSMIFG